MDSGACKYRGDIMNMDPAKSNIVFSNNQKAEEAAFEMVTSESFKEDHVGKEDAAPKSMTVESPKLNDEEVDKMSLADGLPDWTIEPPMISVRRKRIK